MNYHFSTLPNGIKVITVPMRDRESASVAIWLRVGARFETKKVSGVSHFIEHMLFKGTKTRNTRQIKQEIEGVGGLLNAFTGEESTCYFAKLLNQHYPKALEVLADMVNHAVFNAVELEKERTVILEEIKMYRDLPAHFVYDLMGELLWPNQALGRPISGDVETVSGISRREMLDYKGHYYHPKNILVCVSGPVQHQEVLRHAKHLFPQSASYSLSKFKNAVSRQSKPRTLFMDKQTEQTHLVIGMHSFSRHHPDRYKLGLLNIILGANMSSRLFEELREKRGLAYEIKSGVGFYEDTGSVTISAGVETKKVPTAIAVILKELHKIRKSGVHDGELRRAKDYFLSQLSMALEDTMDHGLWLGERMLYSDKLPDLHEIRQGIEAVKTADIREVARRIFKTSSLNLSLIGPLTDKMQDRIKNDFEISGT